MNCNIVINQQSPLSPKLKPNDQKCVEAARRSLENYMKKLKEKLLKDNQEVQITLKEFMGYFQK